MKSNKLRSVLRRETFSCELKFVGSRPIRPNLIIGKGAAY